MSLCLILIVDDEVSITDGKLSDNLDVCRNKHLQINSFLSFGLIYCVHI